MAVSPKCLLRATRDSYAPPSLVRMGPSREIMDSVQALIADGTYSFPFLPSKRPSDRIITGTVQPRVDSVHEFEDVLKAYERIMSLRATGKIIVRVEKDI